MTNLKIFITLLCFYCSSAFSQSAENRLIAKLACCMDVDLEHPKEKVHMQVDAICKQFSGNIVRIKKIPGGFLCTLTFQKGDDLAAAKSHLEKLKEVIYVEQDGTGLGSGLQETIPNDAFFGRQWGLRNDGSFLMSKATKGIDIRMADAWDIETGDSNIVVAVIDGGVKLDHPEFSGRIWKNKKEIPKNNKDDDQNGYVDDVNGWDFANRDNNPTDDFGHGTNVAGIIGANGNNAIGYAGVDWKSKLMILKGLDEKNSGFFSDWADAIYYAVNNGARVINMSVSGEGPSLTLQDAINYALSKNTVVVASMNNNNNEVPYIPAVYRGVIAVGSIDSDGKRSSPFFWSNTSGSCYGSHISVVAPGNYMYGLSHTSNTDYAGYWGGTSQAAPLVSGVAALLLAQNPARTPAQIKSLIESTAEDLIGPSNEDSKGWDKYFGFGKVNAYKALNSILTGLSATSTVDGVNVYPNPSKETFHIHASMPSDIFVLSTEGIVLEEYKNVEDVETGSTLSPGLYFVKIGNSIHKVLKQ